MVTQTTETKEQNKSVSTAKSEDNSEKTNGVNHQKNKVFSRTGGFRKVEPFRDLMGITPNKIASKEPEFITVKPTDVWIDGEYQRDIGRKGTRLIFDIIQNFSWSKFKPPVLTRNDKGQYIAIDGQHTLIGAASHPDIDRVPAIFVPMKDVEQQASSFIAHNTAKVNVTKIDLFYAKLTEGDKETIEIFNLLNKNKIELLRVTPSTNVGQWEARTILAPATLTMLYRKYGKAKLNQILEICGECEFRPIKKDHMIAIAEILYGNLFDDGKSVEPDLLVELIQSLDDTNSFAHAMRISKSTQISRAKALAIYWRNQYIRVYS